MFRLIIFVYITFMFFKKIYNVVQKVRENHISSDKHFFEVHVQDLNFTYLEDATEPENFHLNKRDLIRK